MNPFKQYYFDDFVVGEEFPISSRTMTDALFAAFQLASADNHPSHYDVEYCRKHGMPALGAHGFQILIQSAAGAGWFPHYVEDSMKGFIEQSSRFLKPVYAGDTVATRLRTHDGRRLARFHHSQPEGGTGDGRCPEIPDQASLNRPGFSRH